MIGAISGIAGTGISAVGALEAGQAQAANASYQAQVARNNAQVAQQNAAWTTQSGEAQAAAQGQKSRAAVGSLVAAQGANNIDVNTGSAAEVKTGAQEMANLDTKTTMSNAARSAYGYEVAATSNTAQAGLYSQEAGQASTGGAISSLGSFLSGISSVGANWEKYQNPPPPGAPSASDAGVNYMTGSGMSVGGA